MDAEAAALKAKKRTSLPPPLANPGHSGPTTFFLMSERDMEKSFEASPSKSEIDGDEAVTPGLSVLRDSSYGVQSLADTISETIPFDHGLSRTDSNATQSSADADVENGIAVGRKRKAGNRVHPKIRTTGQRILSHDLASTQASSAASPSSGRPFEMSIAGHLRRASNSSTNLSQPLTPLRFSPQPESAIPSSPRSMSIRSLKLSDEESSVADDTGSQAVQSSSGDDEDEDGNGVNPMLPSDASSMPQLVMPSIAIPARRPFTDRGRRMPRFKIMVIGSRGVGKTSLLGTIFQTCEDIIHVDSFDNSTPGQSISSIVTRRQESTKQISEITASTKSLPPWWYEMDGSRSWRRSSSGEAPLDRNLCFIDTPGVDDETSAQRIEQYVKTLLRRNASTDHMTESEQLHFMAGEGGIHIDAVLYLVNATAEQDALNAWEGSQRPQAELLQKLSQWTNVIAVLTHADLATPEQIQTQKLRLQGFSNALPTQDVQPYAVSSARLDDLDTMDASALMASGYIQPLVPSELPQMIHNLFDPMNMQRLKYTSTRKFMTWRREFASGHIDLPKQAVLQSPSLAQGTLCSPPAPTSCGSLEDEPSKVMVPYSDASYYRSTSPSASGKSGSAALESSTYALEKQTDSPSGTEPFRRVRLAKWAQDLHRSLEKERRRLQKMYSVQPAEWDGREDDKIEDLVLCHQDPEQRPAKGRLGGDLGIIDPRDPLGVLAFGQAFRRRGWFMLQVAGGCGLVGALVYWVHSNWLEVQTFVGFGPQPVLTAPMLAAPESHRGLHYWFEKAMGSARGLVNGMT